jgi:hypothetical protein
MDISNQSLQMFEGSLTVVPRGSVAVSAEKHVELAAVGSDGALGHSRDSVIPRSGRLEKTVSVERSSLVRQVIRNLEENPIAPDVD